MQLDHFDNIYIIIIIIEKTKSIFHLFSRITDDEFIQLLSYRLLNKKYWNIKREATNVPTSFERIKVGTNGADPFVPTSNQINSQYNLIK